MKKEGSKFLPKNPAKYEREQRKKRVKEAISKKLGIKTKDKPEPRL